jgi:hypothetical protein
MFGVIGSNRVAVAVCISIYVEKKSKGQECAEETKTRLPKNWLDVIGSHMLACRCRSFRGVQPLAGIHPSTFRICTGASATYVECRLPSISTQVLLWFSTQALVAQSEVCCEWDKPCCRRTASTNVHRVDFSTLSYPLRIQHYTFPIASPNSYRIRTVFAICDSASHKHHFSAILLSR